MVVTRFAPSPTGYLHIGGLRTALYSYLWAKKNGGRFLLRIEDTDLKRNSQEAVKAINEAFDWVGLESDDEVVYQSQRFDIYKKYIKQLLDEDKAYYCYMSKEELDELRAKQMANKERPRYDGRYRDFKGEPPEGIEPVVRIKSPINETISFNDGVKGEVSFNSSDILDDFIIARSDGTPTYNFVVAIDDALMGITDVIRGDDHLSNTPKQIVVYNALGFSIPKFYHVPMILNEKGKKLSKRDGAMDVMEYKKAGYLPEALLNFLVRLGWSHGDKEIFSLEEMLELFDPNNINASASSYNLTKLNWLNSQYINSLSHEDMKKRLTELGFDISSHPKASVLIDSLKERAETLVEFIQKANSIINRPESYDEKAVKKFLKEQNVEALRLFYEALKSSDRLDSAKEFESFSEEFMAKNELKLKVLAQPIRVAMVGSAVSPSIYEVLEIVGYDEVLVRIENLLDFLKNKKD
jgi:glutamyl-tRNA synthetase